MNSVNMCDRSSTQQEEKLGSLPFVYERYKEMCGYWRRSWTECDQRVTCGLNPASGRLLTLPTPSPPPSVFGIFVLSTVPAKQVTFSDQALRSKLLLGQPGLNT